MSRLAAAPDLADGRRRRGQDNRDRIVSAMLEIVRAGEITPSAEQVAARADVGLRTVFRHFQDMDSLFREMSRAIEVELRAIVAQPLEGADWRERLDQLIARRAVVFEKIAPLRRAAEAVRHRSKFIGSDYARLVATLREILKGLLPPDLAEDPVKFEALDMLMSFEAWSRLRREQSLSVEAAQAVVEAAVTAVAG